MQIEKQTSTLFHSSYYSEVVSSYELFLSRHLCIFSIQSHLLSSYYIPSTIFISWARKASNTWSLPSRGLQCNMEDKQEKNTVNLPDGNIASLILTGLKARMCTCLCIYLVELNVVSILSIPFHLMIENTVFISVNILSHFRCNTFSSPTACFGDVTQVRTYFYISNTCQQYYIARTFPTQMYCFYFTLFLIYHVRISVVSTIKIIYL